MCKCELCGNKTTWDESYGPENFIVCPKCFEGIKKHYKKDQIFNAMMKINELASK